MNIKQLIKKYTIKIYKKLTHIIPTSKKIIIFQSSNGRNYTGNPRYIYEEMIRQGLDKKYKCIWFLFDTSIEVPGNCKKIRNNYFPYFWYLMRAGFWVFDSRQPKYCRKKKNVTYIQTWHGPVGFKPDGRLRGELFSKIGELVSVADAKNIDVLLSNSDWCTDKWKRSFWGEPVIKTGSPRCDILINKREIQYRKIREEFDLKPDSKIVLYAPTFRGGSQNKKREVFAEEFTIDFNLLRQSLHQKFGGEWYIFVRLHPQLALRMQKAKFSKSEYVIDISYKDDLYEYLAAVDVAVTDYSSVAFDAAYMKIPVFLYVDDYKDYVQDRGELLWKYEEIPFSIAVNNKELSEKITEFKYDNYMKKLEHTFENMGLLEDGNATERVINIIKNT